MGTPVGVFFALIPPATIGLGMAKMVGTAVAGGLLLDSGDGRIYFEQVSMEGASALGMTEAERTAFNHELSWINAATEEVFASVSEAPSEQELAQAWNENLQGVSADAKAGMAKVVLGLAKRAE